jgi:CHAT domain
LHVDVIFLAFANQSDDLLPTLQEEDDALNRVLAPRAKERHFMLHRDSFVTLDKLPSHLTLFRDELALFLFSGHAGRDSLLLRDGTANSEGIATMLSQCKSLKAVVLNGCSTEGQVAALLDAGVPVVIATNAPVNDKKATFFSTHFFEALQQQFTLQEAFTMAKGALDTAFKGVKWQQNRSSFEPDKAKEGTWGLFVAPDKAHVLEWKLPVKPLEQAVVADFTPNKHLIENIFKALGEYHDDIQKMVKQEKNGIQVTLPKKRMAILNALPAPLAEPLRKLLVPVEEENDGYDKVSPARLRQLAQAYSTAMELLGFTMLAQLWEVFYTLPNVKMETEQRDLLRNFFRLSRTEREVYNFLHLTRVLKKVFDENSIHYFVAELSDLSTLLYKDEEFSESVHFLNGLRLQTLKNDFNDTELNYLNKRGETCLAYLYTKLGFLARYKLATIQGIDVQKYRHQRTPRFDHTAVILHDLLGGFDYSHVNLERFMDNRSILLIREDDWSYLNLTPFIIDENAFQERTDVCKIFFFSHFLPKAGTFCFKYVYRPDDPLLEVSDDKYPLLKEQFEAFGTLILQQNLSVA